MNIKQDHESGYELVYTQIRIFVIIDILHCIRHIKFVIISIFGL